MPPLHLAETFAAALGQRGREARATLELQAQLAALVEAARAANPKVALDEHRFVAEIAARLEADDELPAALGRLRAAELWLALACARGDRAALAIVNDIYIARVPQLVRRLDPGGALGAEVAEELREKLLVGGPGGPRIADYSGRGDLLGWLRVVALRTALKARRRLERQGQPAPGGEAAAAGLLSGADPERDYLRLRYRGEYEAAFRAALGLLGTAERLLLKLHYADGLTLPQLAAMQRVHRATVARRLAEARRTLLEATRERLQATLKLSDSEFDSVLQLVRSQLVISVRGALADR